MKTTMKRVSTLAGIVCSSATILAADVSVESYARHIVSETGTISDTIWFAPLSGGLLKTGGTTSDMPFANLAIGEEGRVQVIGGRLELTSAQTPHAPSSDAPACLSRAAIWLDASQNVVTDGSGGITRWYDRRESNAGGVWGTSYWRGESKLGLGTSSYPVIRQDANGRDMVYFNGCQGGTWMAFVNQPVSEDEVQITGIRHLFLVFRVTAALGFPLGNTSGYPYFHSGMYNSASFSSGTFFSYNNCVPTMTGGRRYMNGQRCVPEFMSPVQNSEYVFEWENNGSPRSAVVVGNFFNDRGMASNTTYKRGGGDDIGEFIAFTNDLTAVERGRISEYLLAKWEVATSAKPIALSVATNATIAVDVASGSLAGGAPVSFSGGGTVEMSGAGAVALHEKYGDAALPQFALTGGTVNDYGGMIPLDPQGGVACSLANAPMSLSMASAASGTASLAGNTAYRVKSIPASVETLSVSADQLVLAGADGEIDDAVRAGSVEATIAGGNYGFESGTTGWSGGYNGAYTLPNSSAWYTGWDYPAPEGAKALYVHANGAGSEPVSCTVVVPVGGHYELSFYTCARSRSYDAYWGRVDVALVTEGGVTNWVGACNITGALGFLLNRFKTPWLEAGNYTLLLIDAYKRGLSTKTESQPFFDDFHLVRLADAKRSVPVPNGNFEFSRYKYAYSREGDWGSSKYQEHNAPDGWTVSDADRVQSVSDNMLELYRGDDSPYGRNQLALFSGRSDWGNPEKSATSATFKPGSGKWKLRLRGARWGQSDQSYQWAYVQITARPSISAVATVGGADVSLGTWTFSDSDVAMKEFTFPNAFVVLGDDVEVSVRLTQTVPNAAAIVDDLELVPHDELVSGGVFANASADGSWTFTSHKDENVTALQKANADIMYFTADWVVNGYGGAQCSGTRAAEVTQCGEMSQDVTFPEAGTYRLVFWTRARRVGNTLNYAGNKVRAFLSSGATTNLIGITSYSLATNFVRQTFYFDVAAPGTWKFSLQGMNGLPRGDGTYLDVTPGAGFNANDSLVFIDGVSIRKADSLGGAPQGLENKAIELNANTRLRLDFTGDVRIKSLRLGGRKVVGEIDASHPSGLVDGPGTIYVVPQGTCILFR